MEHYQIKLIETIVVFLVTFISFKITQRIIDKFGSKYKYHKSRIKIVRKIILAIAMVILAVITAFIWGINASKLATYIASLFTVLGIAFVAQWSLLSNITATIIIFFNHQVHIGDTIQILDKEFQIEGEISDVGIFFTIIKTNEGEYISLPSNVFIQKMVKKIKR